MKYLMVAALVGALFVVYQVSGAEKKITHVELGERFFHEQGFSRDGTMSCATCHDEQYAFIDSRVNQSSVSNDIPAAASLGQDKQSLGDRNVPSAAYAAFVPEFYLDTSEEKPLFKGGLFLDGRANSLHEQAAQPFVNTIEMQSSKSHIAAFAKSKYHAELQALYGEAVWISDEAVFNAVVDSVVVFERSQRFAAFDSKFDRVLAGKDKFTVQEQRGLDLFKDEKTANCVACHPVPELSSSMQERLFTDFSYDNLGVPVNENLRTLNGKPVNHIDKGLLDNPKVDDGELAGAFRVSSLRNVAVTAPYMHNGVFKDLETVVHFYNSRDVKAAKNPETGLSWAKAEVDDGKNTDELGDLGLSDREVTDIVVFLKTLTDKRYEHLVR